MRRFRLDQLLFTLAIAIPLTIIGCVSNIKPLGIVEGVLFIALIAWQSHNILNFTIPERGPKIQEGLRRAESYIREQTALYRHYCIPETMRIVQQFTGVKLLRGEAIKIVQKIRDEYQMGPIAKYNLR